MGVAGELAPRHPVLRPSSEYQPYTPDRILRKEEGALYVFFELDNSKLKTSFTENGRVRDNAPVLDEIIQITSSILRDTTSSVSRIQIVGLASVEGPEERNIRLSNERASALQHYIQDRLPVPDSLFETVGGGEAWADFADVVAELEMQGGGDGLRPAELRKVLEIIRTEPDVSRREWKIKRLEGGSVYKSLLPHILSDLRNSGYIRIYFDYVPDGNARMINEAIRLLGEGELQSSLAILSTLRDDPRSDEAYAAALLRAGRADEAARVLEAAAARGDSLCARMLSEWNEHLRREREYARYLQELEDYNKTVSTTNNK